MLTLGFRFYSFYVVADLAFGKVSGRLDAGRIDNVVTQVHDAMLAVGALFWMPWAFIIFAKVPILNAEYLKYLKHGKRLG